jgi:hypothetical protein
LISHCAKVRFSEDLKYESADCLHW